MENIKKGALSIVGVTIRTSNKPGQAEKDIPMLWGKFMSDDIKNKIPNRVDETIYALYTDYESDHTEPYTMLLGYQVKDLDNVNEDMTVKIIPAANYRKFVAKGDLTKTAVYDAWMGIWKTDLKRTYTTDFEIYGEKAINPTNGEAEIFIAVE